MSLPSRTTLRRWVLPVVALFALSSAPTLVASSNISNDSAGPAHVVTVQAAPADLRADANRGDQPASRSHVRGHNCPDGDECPPPPPSTQPDKVSVAVQHPSTKPTPTKTTTGKTSPGGGGSTGGTVTVPASCNGYKGNQAIGCALLSAYNFGLDQMSCLVSLWNRESGWRVNAKNPTSGAYGIPQSLPGSKMKSAGSDWQTNPATQIKWGLGYIKGRYGTPCGAWAHSQATGWY